MNMPPSVTKRPGVIHQPLRPSPHPSSAAHASARRSFLCQAPAHPSFAARLSSLALALALAVPAISLSQQQWTGDLNTNWNEAANWSGGVPTLAEEAIFGSPIPLSGNFIQLAPSSLAGSLLVRDDYTFIGGDLTLGTGSVRVELGRQLTLESMLTGSAGLTITGGGALRLANALNDFTGQTLIQNGLLVISNAAQLGADTSAILIRESNPVATSASAPNTNFIGFPGGALVLDGLQAPVILSRDISLQGSGPVAGRGGALISLGDNTLLGELRMADGDTPRTSRILSSNGTLTLAGGLFIGGTPNTHVSSLGGINTADPGGQYHLTGALTGTGTFEKFGSGMLLFTPSDTSGFAGRLRISGGAAGGQSSVRLLSATDSLGNNIISTANGANAAAPIDMNGGILEVRSDDSVNLARNVYLRAGSTFFTGPAPGGQAVNNTLTMGTFRIASNTTATFNSRNGNGVTFTGAWTQENSGNPNTINNNMGGTLLFSGNAWNNSDGNARTLTFGGNGNTTILGSINTSGAGVKTLTKNGSGNLTIAGVATTLNGPVNINAGTVTITDFRSINNNSAVINIGLSGTSAALVIGTQTTPTLAGLITNKTINLAGTTGGASIYANQSGANPVVINSDFTGTGGNASQTKTLFLGGSNTADNIIYGVIPDNNAGGQVNVNKLGPGTWVLAGENTFSGPLTIIEGTLKILANAPTSTVLPSGKALVFGNSNVFAGGTFEFVGQDGVNNLQALGNLTTTSGASTIRLTPGLVGTASLSFTGQSTGAGGTVNFVGGDFTDNQILLPGGNGLVGRTNFWNGADYAYRDGGVLRAPVYGVDPNFVIAPAGIDTLGAGNNEITGDITGQSSISVVTLKFNGSRSLELAAGETLTLTGAGLLATGGSSLITGGDALATGSQALVVRVNLDTDILTIASPVTGTGGLTLSGAGTLALAGPSTATGVITLNEGTLRLDHEDGLGLARTLTMRQGSVLDLNGHSPSANLNAFNNNGVITNSSASPVTITVGGADSGGTSFGSFIETSGRITVIKTGTANQSWLGISSHSGPTIIESTGLITVDHLADIGLPSGIGSGDATDDATNAASLVFAGSGGGLAYAGNIRDINLIYGSQSASTNRLFTLAGTGATLSSTVSNNNAIVWSNYGDIVHAVTGPQALEFTGGSLGDNTFNPRLTDSGSLASGDITSVTKTGAGQWNLGNPNNTYSGFTSVENGVLALNHNGALPETSPVSLGGATTNGILQLSGVFDRDISASPTTGTGTITWVGGGGFAAHSAPLIVAIGGLGTETPLTWGVGGFVADGSDLVLGSISALADVDFRNPIDLNNGTRTILVNDNTNTGADFATLSGVISGDGNLIKSGAGGLRLTGANTYTGFTQIIGNNSVLSVSSLGHSANPGPSSVGDSTNANTDDGAVILGNGASNMGILRYVGPGETSDRKIRLNTTSASQIHADGAGPLILTNVVNDMTTSDKLLFLRGGSAFANTITSQLSDNGGELRLTIDGSALWVLANPDNDYSGLTLVSAGALGIGHDTAIGGELRLSNGNVLAFGGDRVIGNVLSQANGVTAAFIGENSLTFTQPLQMLQTNSTTWFTTNNIAPGSHLHLAGVTANNLTSNTITWTIDGNGTTIIDGDITTSTANGIAIQKAGDGTLILNGTGSNFTQNNRNLDIDRGIVRAGADNVIPALPGHGGLILSPEAADGDTAIFDLNGTLQTINALTATTDGTVVIDNTSALPATLRFGANNSDVLFGAGTGSYTIQNSGGGALSLIKDGDTTATFITGLILDHSGITASEGGGVFNIASPLLSTTGLRAIDASTLNLTGGLANPQLIASIEVGAGSTLSLLDGAGSLISNLTALSLGHSGTGTATLNLNVGDAATDTLTLLTGGVLDLGNTITFNLTDSGLSGNTTYTLLNLADGGLAAFGFANVIQGGMPGGFDSLTWNVTDNLVQLTTGNLILGDWFWTGGSSAWNNASHWSEDKSGLTPRVSAPGAGSDVIFIADSLAGGGVVNTTLEQNFRINSLVFEGSTNPANTPSSVNIAPGSDPANRLEIRPQNPSHGITLAAEGPSTVTISAPFRLGADQTWTIADAAATLSVGPLQGNGALSLNGNGRVILDSPASPLFNTNDDVVITLNGPTLQILHPNALGSAGDANLATVLVNAGSSFFYGGATATVANPVTLNGGVLSAADANQIYSGIISLASASTINLRDANAANLDATARVITLSGGLAGSGDLTLDSNDTLTVGNRITGTLNLNIDNTAWTGSLHLLAGSISTNNPNGLGSGAAITFESGRILFTGAAGDRTVHQNILIHSASGDALGELNLGSNIPVTFTGHVTLGGAGGSGDLRVVGNNDLASATFTGGFTLANDAMIGMRGAAVRLLHIDSVISETGGARALRVNDHTAGGTAGTVRLTGLNTFSGDLTLARGILEFDTVSNSNGAPSSLGQGSSITLGARAGSTLRFIGDGAAASQITDRPIFVASEVDGTNYAGTLDARGTDGATITYAGPISWVPANVAANGNWIVLSGLPGSEGFITGGITLPGIVGDLNVNGGTWTLSGTPSTIADDLFVQGSGAVLRLASPGILQWGDSNDNFLDIRNGGTLILDADDTIGEGIERIYVGQGAAGDIAFLDTNGFNTGAPKLFLGGTQDGREGVILGSGTLTFTDQVEASGINLYRGAIAANLAGPAPLFKAGLGTVILSGDNSGLTASGITATANTRLDAGTLILDYTLSNTPKIPSAARLDIRGMTLVLNGSHTADTFQAVNSTTLGGNGAARIVLNAGTGQNILFSMGDILRGGSAGTLRFTLPAGAQTLENGIGTVRANNATTGLLGSTTANSAAYAIVHHNGGTWFATRDNNGMIVPFDAGMGLLTENNVASWTPESHITDDTTGFAGILGGSRIHSLRFDAPAGGAVNLAPGGVLSITSGGILVTDQVTSGSPGIYGGVLTAGSGTVASGPTELVFFQDSDRTFTVSSAILGPTAITKAGTGTLRLTGDNSQTGIVRLQEGTLELGGLSALGETTRVLLSANDFSTLVLLSDQTIGSIEAASTTDGLRDIGVTIIGPHTLTLNQITGGNRTYSGQLVGTGTLVKNGAGTGTNLNFNNISTEFTGTVIVNGGLFQMSNIGRIDASAWIINKNGALLLDNNSATRSGTRILDTATITLNSADGSLSGQVIPSGFYIRTDQNSTANTTETVGVIHFNSGASYVRLEHNGAANSRGVIIAEDFARANHATLSVRGRALGADSGGRGQLLIGDAANESAFIAALIGGAGAEGSATRSIVPWAIAESTVVNIGNLNMGNSLATYVAGRGFVALDLDNEYHDYATGGATSNVRAVLASDLVNLSGRDLNALVLHFNETALPEIQFSGAGAGVSLTNESGAFLFTLNPDAANDSSYQIHLEGFDDGIMVGGDEYTLFVVNPSALENGPQLAARIDSPLITPAHLTKSGRGTLILTGINTAGGGSFGTHLNEGVLHINALQNIGGTSGALVFAGGTLSLAPGFVDDLSTRSLEWLQAGGVIETNGQDLTFAGSLGSGTGGVTFTGGGTITLNAPAAYLGTTHLAEGNLVIGANNATGNGGDLSLASGTALHLGSNSLAAGRFSTAGTDVEITGTGTLNASRGFIFDHSGHTTLEASLVSSGGGLVKNQGDSLRLNAPATLAGRVEVNAGSLLIADSLSASLVSIAGGATLAGTGTITADVLLAGLPGTSQALLIPGLDDVSGGRQALTIEGSLSLGYGSLVQFTLGQTSFTALEMETIAYVDSTAIFEILLETGYIPAPGASFQLLSWNSAPLGDNLDWTSNLSLPGGIDWDLSLFTTQGILRVNGPSEPPVILTQPQPAAVDINQTATFTVEIGGNEPWLLQWMKDDIDIPGANGLVLTIPGATPADEGLYSVRVSDSAGQPIETSAAAALTVRTIPVITAQPEDATIVSTANHLFQVSVLGPEPISFVWKKGSDPDDPNSFDEIPTAPNSATYLITNVSQADHAGFYLVEITNDYGTVTSDIVELIVFERVGIAQQPQDTTAPQGRFATFSVVPSGDAPPGGFTYQWRLGSTPLQDGPDYEGVNTPTLTVRVTPETITSPSIRYNVQVFGYNLPSNNTPIISANASLGFGPVTIGFDTQPLSQIVPAGSDFTLTAVTSGALPQTFRWLRGSRLAAGANVFNATTDTLLVLEATPANAGIYTLEARTNVLSGSDLALSAPAEIVVVNTDSRRFVIREGARSPRLTIATGGPVTGLQWFETDGVTETPIAGATSPAFTPPALPAGRHLFFCRVTSSAGSLDGGLNEILVFNAAPVINEVPNSALPPTTVGELYEYPLQMSEIAPGLPDPTLTATTFTMRGAPRGLRIDNRGVISGRALVASGAQPFTITITARNAAGPPVSVVKTLVVNDLDQGLVGAFTGPIDRHPLNNNLGGVFNLTTTRTGAFTARVTMGTSTFTGRGALAINSADPANPETTIRVRRGRLTPLDVTFRINAATGVIEHALSRITSPQVAGEAGMRGWINQWAKLRSAANRNPALAYSGYYTAGLNIRDADAAEIPQGTGYYSFTVNAGTGRLTLNGRLADGAAFSTATFVGPQGQVLAFRTLYAANARGSLLGHFVIDPQDPDDLADNTLSNGPEGGLDWLRPADPSPRARVYKNGFFEDLTVVGSRYTWTPANGAVMGIDSTILPPNPNAVVQMLSANVNDPALAQPLVAGANPEDGRILVNVNAANRLTVPGIPAIDNPRALSATINARTGLVTMRFTLRQVNPVGGRPNPVTRTVTILAMIVRDSVDTAALGYFLLPQLPSALQPNNALTPILSGQGSLSKL